MAEQFPLKGIEHGGTPCDPSCLLFLFKIFIYFCLCLVFVAAQTISLAVATGGHAPVVLGLLIVVGSLVAEHGI